MSFRTTIIYIATNLVGIVQLLPGLVVHLLVLVHPLVNFLEQPGQCSACFFLSYSIFLLWRLSLLSWLLFKSARSYFRCVWSSWTSASIFTCIAFLSASKSTLVVIIIIMACRHIPTMTKSYHGGNMSEMINGNVGMCQCQNPTTHDKVQPVGSG